MIFLTLPFNANNAIGLWSTQNTVISIRPYIINCVFKIVGIILYRAYKIVTKPFSF